MEGKRKFDDCITQNKMIVGEVSSCNLLCLKRFYVKSLEGGIGQGIYDNCYLGDLVIQKMSSNKIDFSVSPELERFNPWRENL